MQTPGHRLRAEGPPPAREPHQQRHNATVSCLLGFAHSEHSKRHQRVQGLELSTRAGTQRAAAELRHRPRPGAAAGCPRPAPPRRAAQAAAPPPPVTLRHVQRGRCISPLMSCAAAGPGRPSRAATCPGPRAPGTAWRPRGRLPRSRTPAGAGDTPPQQVPSTVSSSVSSSLSMAAAAAAGGAQPREPGRGRARCPASHRPVGEGPTPVPAHLCREGRGQGARCPPGGRRAAGSRRSRPRPAARWRLAEGGAVAAGGSARVSRPKSPPGEAMGRGCPANACETHTGSGAHGAQEKSVYFS